MKATPTLAASRVTLKQTRSRCPVCERTLSAEVFREKEGGDPNATGTIWMERTCPDHGLQRTLVSSDARFWWLAKGSPENGTAEPGCGSDCGCHPGTLGRNAAGHVDQPFETLSTCIALIEIVHSCNLACPTCYADSPQRPETAVDAVPLDELKARIQGVVDRKGGIEILQLSGGEPTLHPQFLELLHWTQHHPGIQYVLLNTNGVRLAREEAFLQGVDDTYVCGKFQLYLQFDGPGLEGQRELRGADLRALRLHLLERCRDLKIPVTLAMTVTEQNISQIGDAIRLGLTFPQVRGLTFQPRVGSGRGPMPAFRRLNTADIVHAAVGQMEDILCFEDFTPLPCGDPNCATIGYLLKVDGAVRSISDYVDFQKVHGFLRDRLRYDLNDLVECGCESEPLGALLKEFELDASNTFRLFIKPFMDACSWDEDRIDRCCTHVIRPDGKLDSFCRYYAGGRLEPAPV